MPLYEADIRTMQAEDIGQYDRAGGRMSAVEVTNGQVGNVFGRLGREDRAAGAVDLVKLFLWGDSQDRTEAHNASTILTTRPQDPHVSVVLFRPGSAGDRALHSHERTDAQSYVEAYLVPGTPLQYYMWGAHQVGSPEIRMWSYVTEGVVAPVVGDVLYIGGSNFDADTESDRYYQVTDVTSEARTVQSEDGPIECLVAYCTINKPLAVATDGIDVVPDGVGSPDPALYDTAVADAARFYGTHPLAVAADAGDSVIKVDSVYDAVVPTQTSDISLGNPLAIATKTQTIVTGGRSVEVTGEVHSTAIEITAANRSTTYTRTLAPVAAADTINVHYRALGRWYVIDEAASGAYGTITRVDADTVSATLTARPDADTVVLWLWATPAHYEERSGLSIDIDDVGPSGQLALAEGKSLLLTSASVQWVQAGVTHTASANAAGVLTDDNTYDEVGYLLPSGVYGLSARPDADTSITVDYQPVAISTETFTGLTPDANGSVSVTLGATPDAGTVTVQWAETKRSTSAVTVYRRYWARGWGYLPWAAPGALQLEVYINQVSDNGSGALGADGLLGSIVGTTLTANVVTFEVVRDYDHEEGRWVTANQWSTLNGGSITVSYAAGGAGGEPATTEVLSSPALAVRVVGAYAEAVVPGSLRLRLDPASEVVEDSAGDGVLYGVGGAFDGQVVGAIDYVTGMAEITRWTGNPTGVLVLSMVTQIGEPQQTDYAFRTAGSPLIPGELGIQATETDGDAVSVQVPSDGVIADAAMTGTAQHDIGVAYVTFTNPVWPSTVRYSGSFRKTIPMDPDLVGLDPTRLGDGRVPIYRVGDLVVIQEWKSVTLPAGLSAGQVFDLGAEGVAQIYVYDGAGEQTQQLPSGITSAQEIDLGATYLEYCLLRDADGRALPAEMFTADLETGIITMATPLTLDGWTEPLVARYVQRVDPALWEIDLDSGNLTFADPLDLSAYTQPLTASYRIEDERIISDVQITGEIGVSQPLNNTYTTAAVACSKLRHGDLKARCDPVWSQNTWTGAWSDALLGDAPSGGGKFDDTAYPPLVTNHGAITERWRLSRQSNGTWSVIGETVGQQAVWDGISTLQVEYLGRVALQLDHNGLGGGWATGNQIRINTYGCQGPYWALRCTTPGAADLVEDGCYQAQRVDAD